MDLPSSELQNFQARCSSLNTVARELREHVTMLNEIPSSSVSCIAETVPKDRCPISDARSTWDGPPVLNTHAVSRSISSKTIIMADRRRNMPPLLTQLSSTDRADDVVKKIFLELLMRSRQYQNDLCSKAEVSLQKGEDIREGREKFIKKIGSRRSDAQTGLLLDSSLTLQGCFHQRASQLNKRMEKYDPAIKCLTSLVDVCRSFEIVGEKVEVQHSLTPPIQQPRHSDNSCLTDSANLLPVENASASAKMVKTGNDNQPVVEVNFIERPISGCFSQSGNENGRCTSEDSGFLSLPSGRDSASTPRSSQTSVNSAWNRCQSYSPSALVDDTREARTTLRNFSNNHLKLSRNSSMDSKSGVEPSFSDLEVIDSWSAGDVTSSPGQLNDDCGIASLPVVVMSDKNSDQQIEIQDVDHTKSKMRNCSPLISKFFDRPSRKLSKTSNSSIAGYSGKSLKKISSITGKSPIKFTIEPQRSLSSNRLLSFDQEESGSDIESGVPDKLARPFFIKLPNPLNNAKRSKKKGDRNICSWTSKLQTFSGNAGNVEFSARPYRQRGSKLLNLEDIKKTAHTVCDISCKKTADSIFSGVNDNILSTNRDQFALENSNIICHESRARVLDDTESLDENSNELASIPLAVPQPFYPPSKTLNTSTPHKRDSPEVGLTIPDEVEDISANVATSADGLILYDKSSGDILINKCSRRNEDDDRMSSGTIASECQSPRVNVTSPRNKKRQRASSSMLEDRLACDPDESSLLSSRRASDESDLELDTSEVVESNPASNIGKRSKRPKKKRHRSTNLAGCSPSGDLESTLASGDSASARKRIGNRSFSRKRQRIKALRTEKMMKTLNKLEMKHRKLVNRYQSFFNSNLNENRCPTHFEKTSLVSTSVEKSGGNLSESEDECLSVVDQASNYFSTDVSSADEKQSFRSNCRRDLKSPLNISSVSSNDGKLHQHRNKTTPTVRCLPAENCGKTGIVNESLLDDAVLQLELERYYQRLKDLAGDFDDTLLEQDSSFKAS